MAVYFERNQLKKVTTLRNECNKMGCDQVVPLCDF